MSTVENKKLYIVMAVFIVVVVVATTSVLATLFMNIRQESARQYVGSDASLQSPVNRERQTVPADAVAKKDGDTVGVSEVKELTPHGYVIRNEFFYSPVLGLSFSGHLDGLVFKDAQFTSPSWDGSIKVFARNGGQATIDAIKGLVKNEGKNPENCSFDTTEDAGEISLTVRPTSVYKPTDEELFSAYRKDHPEIKTVSDYRAYCKSADAGPTCSTLALALVDAYNENVCSSYAAPEDYHRDGHFQFPLSDSANSTYIYVQNGSGQVAFFSSVHFRN